MNILYICDEYPPGRHGGIGTAVQILAREMVLQGHRVTVAGFYDWAYDGEDEFDDEGVHVYRFRRSLTLPSWLRDLDALPTRIAYRILNAGGIFHGDIKSSLKKYHAFLEEVIARHSIDIVEIPDYHDYMRFCHSPVPFPRLSVPTVIKLHGSIAYFLKEAGKEIPPAIMQMERDLFMRAEAWASVSRYTLDKTRAYLGLGEKKSAILYNGIHVPEQTNVTKVANRVVFTGTLVEKKGIYQLMKAWNNVHERIPGAELWVFGKGNTAKVQALLSKAAAETVVFKGHVSRNVLLKSLAEASVGVFPSYAETFGLAAVEAMACGTAVIFTRRTSGLEIMTHKKNGLLVDPDNVEEISNEIIFLLENSAVCNNLAKMGRNRAIEAYSIDVVAQKHLDFYLDVINDVSVS